MTNYPNQIDDDVTLPSVIDNITENGADAINALKDAVIALETEMGTNPSGVLTSVADRLAVCLNADGTLKASVINSLGAATLPIYNSQVASNAAIAESKLDLDYSTAQLQNDLTLVKSQADYFTSWIYITGTKLQPHLDGANFNHLLKHIFVSDLTSEYIKNKFGINRDNSNAYTLINSINTDFTNHEKSDGTGSGTSVVTVGGQSYPSNFAHTSSGLFVDTSRLGYIPQTANSVQDVIEFFDNSSLFLYGTRVQNLYSNGISKVSRSSDVNLDGYGNVLFKDITCTTYLRNTGSASYPFDDINSGDDVIKITPSAGELLGNSFDSKFALIKSGDIVRVNYGGIEVQHIVKEKKYIQSGINKTFILRIDGKNLKYTTVAKITVSRMLANENKFGSLAVGAVHNSFSEKPSLNVISSRNAMVTGIGFYPESFSSSNYNLYLALYPTGNPADGYTVLPAIDITGDLGLKPGSYSLESIIASTNDGFRAAGYNLRFQAFEYKGSFGIAMTDPIGGASFSIVSGVVDSNGFYDSTATNSSFPNNVIELFDSGSVLAKDPLGFGPRKANVASPLYQSTYLSAEQSLLPTKIYKPLSRNNFYVNAIELDRLSKDVDQFNDSLGDGYWVGQLVNRNVIPSVRVEATYRIYQDLSTSKLEIGKSVTVQSNGYGTTVDFGRFIISNVDYTNCNLLGYTEITLYDVVHAAGSSPQTTLGSTGFGSGSEKYVRIYFGDDSIGFNDENVTDNSTVSPFKRFFEVYIDSQAKTFTHERARMYLGATNVTVNGVTLLANVNCNLFDICFVSNKLKGYNFSYLNKITLTASLNATTGVISGYLSDSGSTTHKGIVATGRIGEVIRFYDESGVDYIEMIAKTNVSYTTFTNQNIDIQIFPTLSLDQEIMLLSSCQLNDYTKKVEHLRDLRQFGNTSEKDLSTSALNYISSSSKFTHINGVIQGFDLQEDGYNPTSGQLRLKGGKALISGKVFEKDAETIVVPLVKEVGAIVPLNILWALCLNDKNELDIYPLINGGTGVSRRINVLNVITATSYYVEGYTFEDLVEKKNLCVLYLLDSQISLSNVQNVLATDVRRYSKDSDTSSFAKYTSSNSFGNYKNAQSILTWMSLNNHVTTAQLGGCNETIYTSITLGGSNAIVLDGQKNGIINFNMASFFAAPTLTLKSNVTLKDLTLNFVNGKIAIETGADNIVFDGCNITVGSNTSSPYMIGQNIIEFDSSSNVVFKNCTFNVNYYGVSIDGGKVLSFTNGSTFEFANNTVNCLHYNAAGATIYSSFIYAEESDGIISENTFITDCSAVVSYNNCNNLTVIKNNITARFNPLVSGDVSYVSSDHINYQSGYFKGTCSTPDLNEINISENKFIFDTISGSYKERYSYIVLELSDITSSVNSVLINDNSFSNIGESESSTVSNFDVKAAIAIVNSYSSVSPDDLNTNLNKPTIKKLSISNNICDNYNTIFVGSKTTVTLDGEYVSNPGLCVLNGQISNNTCGNIGYWVASKLTNNTNSNKNNLFEIYNNNCKLIATMNHKGYIFKPLSVAPDGGLNQAFPKHKTGHVIISGNTTSWIQSGQSLDFSFNTISDNTCYAYNKLYRELFENKDGYYLDGFLSENVAIYNLGTDDLTTSKNINCIIKNNKIYKSDIVNSLGIVTGGYEYKYAGIYTNVSSEICGNSIDYVIDDDFAHRILFGRITVSANNFNIHNNTILNNTIGGLSGSTNYYVAITGYTDTMLSTPTGIITDNSFESPKYSNVTDDGLFSITIGAKTAIGNTIADVDKVFNNITSERNKNQSKYAYIKPIEDASFNYGTQYIGSYIGETISSSKLNLKHGGDQNQVLSFVLETANTQGSAKKVESIEGKLPDNVRLTNLSFSTKKYGNAEDYFTIVYSISRLQSGNDVFDIVNDTNPDFQVALDKTDSTIVTPGAYVNGSKLSNSTSLLSKNYYTNHNNNISLHFYILVARTPVGANPLVLDVTGALITYRW